MKHATPVTIVSRNLSFGSPCHASSPAVTTNPLPPRGHREQHTRSRVLAHLPMARSWKLGVSRRPFGSVSPVLEPTAKICPNGSLLRCTAVGQKRHLDGGGPAAVHALHA
ncbi:hypothetical protein HETIRDRAFT_321359 [Heterobasidion irregulare TC 32-1]|uniref:Uncharacterized protein n=1 Tax=Heterobasidion irregulare (strain TC 32-1) TaxID=747525 RepID=W4K5M5_HETIT|nr:uncharacterized protein HETIRDRAFT_321359 [Heterobasidion irregulare TC 32-1]ETW81112.1 hypothetical protein HETIRDRAFT_321359 [Heterobasidion irregulare TC 32-1]